MVMFCMYCMCRGGETSARNRRWRGYSAVAGLTSAFTDFARMAIGRINDLPEVSDTDGVLLNAKMSIFFPSLFVVCTIRKLNITSTADKMHCSCLGGAVSFISTYLSTDKCLSSRALEFVPPQRCSQSLEAFAADVHGSYQ